MQGISIALHERLTWDRRTGIPLNAGYHGAKIITHVDAPLIEVGFVESNDDHGPFERPSARYPSFPLSLPLLTLFTTRQALVCIPCQ